MHCALLEQNLLNFKDATTYKDANAAPIVMSRGPLGGGSAFKTSSHKRCSPPVPGSAKRNPNSNAIVRPCGVPAHKLINQQLKD